MADDAQELLVLILPRLLLLAPKRTPGNNTKVKTHAEAMQETGQLRLQATKLVGERLAHVELLRGDELEANGLRTRLAKPEGADGADDEEEGAQKAAAAAVNLVQTESLTRAMKRLTSHGIASLDQQKRIKSARSWHKKHSRHSQQENGRREAKSKATELDFPTFTERIRDTARGGRADAFGIDSVRALHTPVGRPRSGRGTGQVCQPDSDSTDQRETVRGDGMHKPGSGEVRNQRQTPTATNWHNTRTTRGSYTGSTQQGKLERNSGAGAVCDG